MADKKRISSQYSIEQKRRLPAFYREGNLLQLVDKGVERIRGSQFRLFY
jgi:hypothetical protein